MATSNLAAGAVFAVGETLLHLDQVVDENNARSWVLRSRDPASGTDTILATYTDFQAKRPLLALDEHTGDLWVAERRNNLAVRWYRLNQTTWQIEATTFSGEFQDATTYPGTNLTAFCIDYPDYVSPTEPGPGYFVIGFAGAGVAYYREAKTGGAVAPAEFFETGQTTTLRGLFHLPPDSGAPGGDLCSVAADGTIHRHTSERLGTRTQVWYAAGTYRKAADNPPSMAQYESDVGAVRTFTMRNRAQVTITTPLPMVTEDPTDPDALTLYLARETLPATAEDWWRQPPPEVGVRRIVVTEMAADLGHPPETSTFPDASPGRLNSGAGDDLGPYINLTGNGTVGHDTNNLTPASPFTGWARFIRFGPFVHCLGAMGATTLPAATWVDTGIVLEPGLTPAAATGLPAAVTTEPVVYQYRITSAGALQIWRQADTDEAMVLNGIILHGAGLITFPLALNEQAAP